MVQLPSELEQLKRFHGHLGPYVVIGYRMGLLAREQFPDRIFCMAGSGTQRPLSCLADGIQFSSSCTLGKGNIRLLEEGKAAASFSDGRKSIEMELKGEVRRDIDARTTKENEEAISMDLFEAPLESLIVVTAGKKDPFGRA